MYAIHTTPGFIIDARPYGEAGKVITIFTRELGLVSAVAQGIRLEKSKLRYHAREYTFGIFSFVRGKDVWRLTSAQKEENEKRSGERGTKDGRAQELLARVAVLLKRLLHGEEPNVELYDVAEGCKAFLNTAYDITTDQFKTLESLIVLRILQSLGYVGKDAHLVPFFDFDCITLELLDQALPHRTLINQHINKALKESHL